MTKLSLRMRAHAHIEILRIWRNSKSNNRANYGIIKTNYKLWKKNPIASKWMSKPTKSGCHRLNKWTIWSKNYITINFVHYLTRMSRQYFVKTWSKLLTCQISKFHQCDRFPSKIKLNWNKWKLKAYKMRKNKHQ